VKGHTKVSPEPNFSEDRSHALLLTHALIATRTAIGQLTMLAYKLTGKIQHCKRGAERVRIELLLSLRNRPFPDQNQVFLSGRTFTFEQANKNDWDWDKAAVPA
jgi:hypothetical protein